MTIDDENTKIRKNLVAASSLMLIAMWLDIPYAALLSKISNGHQDHVSPLRLFAVGQSVLVYLGLRYRFSDQWEHYVQEFDREHLALTDSIFRRRMGKDLLKLCKSMKTWRYFDHNVLTEYIKCLSVNGIDPKLITDGTVKLQVQVGRFDHMPGYKSADLYAKVVHTLPFGGFAFDTKCSVSYPLAIRLWLRGKASLEVWAYSQESVVYRVPAIMGLLATTCLLWKTVATIFCSQA